MFHFTEFVPSDPEFVPSDPEFVPSDPEFVPSDPEFVPSDNGFDPSAVSTLSDFHIQDYSSLINFICF
jgi:hypothetical protein